MIIDAPHGDLFDLKMTVMLDREYYSSDAQVKVNCKAFCVGMQICMH